MFRQNPLAGEAPSPEGELGVRGGGDGVAIEHGAPGTVAAI